MLADPRSGALAPVHLEPAINRETLARDVIGLLRGQVERQPGDLHGSPGRFHGIFGNCSFIFSGSSVRCAVIGVRMRPGAIALTLIRSGASSSASDRVKVSNPPLQRHRRRCRG